MNLPRISRFPNFLFLPLLAALLLLALPAGAQVVVYKVKFEPVRSVNLDFYNEGYFVAPATGGAGSFIFTVNKRGEKVYSPTAPGRLFFALTQDNTVKWIVSAGTGTSAATTGASYVCFGTANQSARFRGPTFDIRTRIASSLRGGVTAFSEEAAGEDAAEDGTISFAAVMDFRMGFDKDRSNEANRKGQTVAEAVADLIAELRRRGYESETAASTTTTPSTTTPAATTQQAPAATE